MYLLEAELFYILVSGTEQYHMDSQCTILLLQENPFYAVGFLQ